MLLFYTLAVGAASVNPCARLWKTLSYLAGQRRSISRINSSAQWIALLIALTVAGTLTVPSD